LYGFEEKSGRWTKRGQPKKVFTEFHATPYGTHCGTEKNKLAILARFYWPGMGVDIDKWVNVTLFLSNFVVKHTNVLCFGMHFSCAYF